MLFEIVRAEGTASELLREKGKEKANRSAQERGREVQAARLDYGSKHCSLSFLL